ncbi:hypothetical protein [Streptomyces albus]|uniref:hypothetical protein n=1 Tax=Streptomyces albus TaxID=1888 RepID=UPI00068E786E|nr:hypothetical protein [Streptomyces albus]
MATATANPPIYQLLVEEHGDVLAATRDAARETQRAASAALDWSDLRPARGAREHGRTEQGRTEHGDASRERARESARTSAPDRAPESERGHDDATDGTGAPENAPAEAGASTGTPAAGSSAAETPAAGTGTDWSDRSEQPEPAGH